MGEVCRLVSAEPTFGLQAAGHLMLKVLAPWVQDLSLLVESVEAARPARRAAGLAARCRLRLPFSKKICSDGQVVCSQALMALADTAMVIACSAAWNGYRPMSTIDQTTHFLRPVTYDIVADARVVRIGSNTSFGRVMMINASISGLSAWWRAPTRSSDAGSPASGPSRSFQFFARTTKLHLRCTSWVRERL